MYTAWTFLTIAAVGSIPCLIFIAKSAWRGQWGDVVLVMLPLFLCAIVGAAAVDIGGLFQ